MSKILTYQDIETISIAQIANADFIVTNTGLSAEMIEELSKDVSNDFIIQLVRIELNGVWRTFSNDPTEPAGIDENGNPIYKTVWNGEEWAYIQFESMLNSIKSSGEIVGGSFEIANYNTEIALAVSSMQRAIPIKLYYVSKKTWECVLADEYKYLSPIVNTGAVIQAESRPADPLSEQLPTATYNPYNFKI